MEIKKIATRDGYGKGLVKAGRENENVVVLIADLGASLKSRDFQKEFPDRFYDFGIAEANMVCTGAGFAASGKIPFCSTFAVFGTGLTYNQLRQSVCYSELNVKVACTHAGLTVGEDGATHQALEDVSLMRGLPHMTVLVPADAVEAEKAVVAAARHQGPCYLRFGREPVKVIYNGTCGDSSVSADSPFEIGKAVRLREGKDVTVFACGVMVGMALEAAKTLESEGVSARVINMHTIKPIDKNEILAAAAETKRIVTAEEHSIIGGLGSVVAEVLAENTFCHFKRLGTHDTFGESGKAMQVMEKFGLTPSGIADAVREMMKR